MHPSVREAEFGAELSDFRPTSVPREGVGGLGSAPGNGFARLKKYRMQRLCGFVSPNLKRTVVKDVAVLVDFEQRGTLVGLALGELVAKVGWIAVHASGNPGGTGSERQCKWIQRMVDASAGGRLGDLTLFTRGRKLALGQPVDLIVEQQDGHVEVAAKGVNEVVSPNAQRIAITGDNPDVEVGVRQLDSGGYRWGAAVQRMDSVAVDVVWKAAAAADSADNNCAIRVGTCAREYLGELLQNAVVAATRAPANFFSALKVFGGQFHSSASSSVVNGCPVVLHTDSTRHAHSPCRWCASWPSFISTTTTRR